MGENILLDFEVFDALRDGVYIVNSERKILYWNKSAEKLTDYSASEVVGSYCYDNILQHIDCKGNELCRENCPLKRVCGDGKSRELELYLHNKEGQRKPIYVRGLPYKDEEGNIIGAIEIFSDSEERRKLLREIEKLKKLAYYDDLTKVASRRYILKFLEDKLAEYNINKRSFGVYYIDVDDFKKINDEYGHVVGDKVLYNVATTLKNALKYGDMIGRLGGEEFVIILNDSDADRLKKMGNILKILTEYTKTYDENSVIRITTSIGGTLVGAEDGVEKILKRADKFLYEAKKSGKNSFVSDV